MTEWGRPLIERAQVRITLPEAFRATIDPLRRKWIPEHAIGNPAHLTIIYHDEAPDLDLLMTRLLTALSCRSAFPLELGLAQKFPDSVRGAFLNLLDPTGGVSGIREIILTPPFSERVRFSLHATILHPSHGDRLNEAWPDIRNLPALGRFIVDEVQVVGSSNHTIATIRLAGDLP